MIAAPFEVPGDQRHFDGNRHRHSRRCEIRGQAYVKIVDLIVSRPQPPRHRTITAGERRTMA